MSTAWVLGAKQATSRLMTAMPSIALGQGVGLAGAGFPAQHDGAVAGAEKGFDRGPCSRVRPKSAVRGR